MTKEKNINSDIDLNKYKESGSLSLGEMNFGLWLSENRSRIRRMIVIALIIISAGLFIYSTYNYFVYVFIGKNTDNIVGGQLLAPRNAVQDVVVGELKTFQDGDMNDLAIQLTNPNDKFFANFNYCFLAGDQEINCGSAFILPKEGKYLLALGQKIDFSKGNINFKIKDIFWQRTNAHQISDWDSFALSRLDFAVSDINFATAARSGLSEKINLNSLDFNISNRTPYSYYEVPLNILLFSGNDLVGVNQYLLKNFKTGQTESVKLSWPGNLNYVSRTDVQPNLNILDNSVYLLYQGASGQ